jgi:hypothetical protein
MYGDSASVRLADEMVLRWDRQSPAADVVGQPGMGSGACAYALLSHYAATVGSPGAHERFVGYVERAATLFNEGQPTAELYRGVTGLGWLLAHFGEQHGIEWANAAMDQIDEVVEDEVLGTKAPEMDLIGGLTGIMVYALARHARGGNSSLVTSLGRRIQNELRAWTESPPAAQDRGFWSNAGVAHGVPGAILVLLQAHRQGVPTGDETPDVLRKALDRLWSYAIFEHDGGVNFPYHLRSLERARLAWCYGALGVVQLYASTTDLHPESSTRFRRVVHSILQQATAPDAGIADASLCHGTAGLAFVLNRLSRDHQLSDEQRGTAASLAETQLARVLREEIPTPHGSTFMYVTDTGRVPSSAFLTGGIGAALAVQAWNHPLPVWAELLAIY